MGLPFPPQVLMTWSAGSHMCLGMNLAIMEMKAVLALMVGGCRGWAARAGAALRFGWLALCWLHPLHIHTALWLASAVLAAPLAHPLSVPGLQAANARVQPAIWLSAP